MPLLYRGRRQSAKEKPADMQGLHTLVRNSLPLIRGSQMHAGKRHVREQLMSGQDASHTTSRSGPPKWVASTKGSLSPFFLDSLWTRSDILPIKLINLVMLLGFAEHAAVEGEHQS
jgi:hypothetical protein